jgi:hypothetical protein
MLAAAAAVRTASRVAARRAMSSEASSTGPRLPQGNDPAAFHSQAAASADTSRWMWITAAFGIPVMAFGVVQSMNKHGTSLASHAALHQISTVCHLTRPRRYDLEYRACELHWAQQFDATLQMAQDIQIALEQSVIGRSCLTTRPAVSFPFLTCSSYAQNTPRCPLLTPILKWLLVPRVFHGTRTCFCFLYRRNCTLSFAQVNTSR